MRKSNDTILNTVIAMLKENSQDLFSHDLYREGFNPVSTRAELGKEKSEDPLVCR